MRKPIAAVGEADGGDEGHDGDRARRPEPAHHHAGQRHGEHRAGRDGEQHSPSACGDSSSASRTCGIRDAQLANAKPARMKTA